MHELGIAMEIAELAAEKAGADRVVRVIVDVGALTAVLPDALAFAWDAAIEGSAIEGAQLEITVVPGRGRCGTCATEAPMTMPFGRCACGGNLAIVDGEQLRIRQLEVETWPNKEAV